MAEASPDWFLRAVGQAPELRDVEIDGCRVRLRTWGEPGQPGIVLVHGGAAHAGWWDHVAPFLAVDRFVVAVDLSGHGDSEWRGSYSTEVWSDEVEAAALLAAAGGPPAVVVGHSMGGRVAVMCAARRPESVGAVVLVDSPLADRRHDEELLARRRRPTLVYPGPDDAVSRWATLPPQDGNLPFVRDRVARHSLRQVDGGWTWKFDPGFFGRASTLGDALDRVRCPLVLLHSEQGILSARRVQQARERLGASLDVVELPAAGHHPMLDQPLLLIGALRAVLELGATRRRERSRA
ncbi:alpha/beta fold hydrolase [uncultured Jatrophihabitans sp.]|uniref:alpha/beta fold hydrolase n=1 Tax=uncultured Jatrophihabitans sp. TaxID=1610747 RepID=UPI0035CB15C2